MGPLAESGMQRGTVGAHWEDGAAGVAALLPLMPLEVLSSRHTTDSNATLRFSFTEP